VGKDGMEGEGLYHQRKTKEGVWKGGWTCHEFRIGKKAYF